jgi:peptidyl-prolyl cis-trans isomerase SurA
MLKKLFIFFIISFLFFNFTKSQEIIIISKVDGKIITNIDIEIEKKYLLLLNNKLNVLSEKEMFVLAKNSLIKEIIKKKEINKLFIKQNEKTNDKIIENFYNRLGFNNKNEFIKFLNNNKISFESLKEKLIIEGLWNQIIYSKFNNKVRIDKNSIEKEIVNYYNSKDKKYEYNLSEIEIDIEKDINFKIKEITKYIEQFGFKVAANKYSKSDTSKFGGEIGWINFSRLAKNIKNKISIIKIGEITEPIQTSNGYIILKLNNKREIKEKFDLENELKQQIKYERNRQLNQFSSIYYKKLKKNTNVYENK